MRRYILIALSILFISSLFVSCNDGTEGLFQMAANSVKKEEYSIKQIINKNGNRYVVTTDNGIALYDVSSRTYSSFMGTGVQATNAIWASADGSSFVYYDNITDKYYDQNGELPSGAYDDYIPKPFYSPDGEHFTYVFQKKSDSSYWYAYLLHPAASLDAFKEIFISSSFKKIDIDNIKGVSIIGNGVFSVAAADKYYIYYADDNTSFEVLSPALAYLKTNLDEIYLLYDGSIWSISKGKTPYTIATHINPVMFKGADYSYFIIQGSSDLYQINEEDGNPTVSSIAISGLQNVEIVSIISQSGSELRVLTSNSGLRTIDLNNKTIN